MQEPDHSSSDPQSYENEQVPFSYELDALNKEPVAQRSDDPPAFQSDVHADPEQQERSAMPGMIVPEAAASPSGHGRSFWIALASVFAVLLISALSLPAYFYMNRSTPVKTLDGFCTALQQGDYAQAYSAFSPKLQSILSESRFASFFVQDKVVSCTHGAIDDSSSSATTALKLVHASTEINSDTVTLVKDATNIWKISDVRKA